MACRLPPSSRLCIYLYLSFPCCVLVSARPCTACPCLHQCGGDAICIRISQRRLSLRFSVGTTKPLSDACGRGDAGAVRGRAVWLPRSRDGRPSAKLPLVQAFMCCWCIATGSDFLNPKPRTEARCFGVFSLVYITLWPDTWRCCDPGAVCGRGVSALAERCGVALGEVEREPTVRDTVFFFD
eukprot:COSAG02_NODE_20804_length_815_cov_0.956704_1_plen_182_part_01